MKMNWSYVAGYFDADGNIHVNFNAKKISFQAAFRIYSTNKNVLNKIKSLIGLGHIYVKRRKEINWRDVFEYSIGKKSEVRFVLKKVAPYLIVKKERVDYLLKHFDFGRNSNKEFDLDIFRSSITRKNQEKQRKAKTLKGVELKEQIKYAKELSKKEWEKIKSNPKSLKKFHKQQKKYRQKPEVKKRIKEYYQKPEVKKRIKEYDKKYRQRPEVKARRRKLYHKYHKIIASPNNSDGGSKNA